VPALKDISFENLTETPEIEGVNFDNLATPIVTQPPKIEDISFTDIERPADPSEPPIFPTEVSVLDISPQIRRDYISRIKTAAQKFAPEDTIGDRASRVILTALDPAIDIAHKFGGGLQFLNLKLLQGLTFNAPEIVVAAINRINPELTKGRTFEQATLEAAEFNPSGFTRTIGEIVEFVGRIRTGQAIGSQLGLLGGTPKSIGIFGKMIEGAKLGILAGSGEQVSLKILEAIDPETDYGYQGAIGPITDAAALAAFSIGNDLILRPAFAKVASTKIGQSVIKAIDKFIIKFSAEHPRLADFLATKPDEFTKNFTARIKEIFERDTGRKFTDLSKTEQAFFRNGVRILARQQKRAIRAYLEKPIPDIVVRTRPVIKGLLPAPVQPPAVVPSVPAVPSVAKRPAEAAIVPPKPTQAKPEAIVKIGKPITIEKIEPAKEVVITKPSEVITKIPKAPKIPVTETPTIPLKGKEAQIFREEVRTQEKITAAEAGEVGLEPAGTSFTEHIDTFQSYQLPETSQIPRITKQMKKVNGLRLSGKITSITANKRIHKLRELLIQQAIKEKIALRTSKKGKVKIALRKSGVFVPEEVATYKKYKDIEPILGGGQDITRAIQQMDGALPIKEKLKVKGQAGPIERFVLWRTRKMTLQKLNWLKEKTIEIRNILSAKKGSTKDKEINLILEKIGTTDRNIPIENILDKKTLASFSKESIKSAQELRQFYDDLIEEQNAARLMRGQDEIPYRQNYSPNILRDTTVWEQLFLRDKTAKILEKKDLPDYIKPNMPFNPRAQAREADIPYDKRILSARELAESYIMTASKDIFNTSIIQNNKAFIDQLRGQGLEKSAEYLAEWTATSYAGIKPKLDRAIKLPKWAGGGLRYFNRLRNLAVFPLNVAWSLSTQPLSLSNTIGRYGLPNTIRGFFQWLKPSIRKQAAQDYFSFIVKSTKRGGVTRQDASNLLGENIKTQKTVGEFIENYSTILLTEIEKLLTGTSIRAAHIQGFKRGLRGEALKNFASDGGGKTQSMYNDEDKPMILRSLLVKSAAPYQTYAFEVANTFREWAGRTGTPPDSKLYAMWSVTRWLASLIVLKTIANAVRGKKWSWWDLIPIPFREFWLTPIARKLTGEFVPGSAGLPAPIETGTRVAKGINDVLETGNWRKLRNEMLRYGPGVFGIPGGVQWARMVDAIIVYSSGGLTDRQGKVLFEMKDIKDLARAMFTGVWSTKAGRERLKPSKKQEETAFD